MKPNLTPLVIAVVFLSLAALIVAQPGETSSDPVYLIGSSNGRSAAGETFPRLDGSAETHTARSHGLFETNMHARIGETTHGNKNGALFEDSNDRGRFGETDSAADFVLPTPPWPSWLDSRLLHPAVVSDPRNGKPGLRVRFYSRHAQTVHCVGSWDGWAGETDLVGDTVHRAEPTAVPDVYEYHIPLTGPGRLEYKFVLDAYSWISDPSVIDTNEAGHTTIDIHTDRNIVYANFQPRFSGKTASPENVFGLSGNLAWLHERAEGFSQASMSDKPMLWVITVPGSDYGTRLMKSINGTPEVTETLRNYICLETPASDVLDILQSQDIGALPCVVLVDKTYNVVWQETAPSLEEIHQQASNILN